MLKRAFKRVTPFNLNTHAIATNSSIFQLAGGIEQNSWGQYKDADMHLEINPSKSPRFMWVWMNFEILLVSPWTCHCAWQIFDPMSNTVQLLSYIWPRVHTWYLPFFPQTWCAILFTNMYHFPTNKIYSFCFHSDNLPPDRICSMWCSKQKSGMRMPSQIWC